MKVDTGFTDNNAVPIYDGDKMIIPKYLDSKCWVHRVTCTVRFNKDWNKWGLQNDEDGEWLTGSVFFCGFSKVY